MKSLFALRRRRRGYPCKLIRGAYNTVSYNNRAVFLQIKPPADTTARVTPFVLTYSSFSTWGSTACSTTRTSSGYSDSPTFRGSKIHRRLEGATETGASTRRGVSAPADCPRAAGRDARRERRQPEPLGILSSLALSYILYGYFPDSNCCRPARLGGPEIDINATLQHPDTLMSPEWAKRVRVM